jgi:hypothetical protein
VSVLLCVHPRLDRKIQYGLSCSSFGLSQCKMEDAFQKGSPWVVSCNPLYASVKCRYILVSFCK